MKPLPEPGPWTERFWMKVHKTKDCWLWIAATTSAGYGDFRVGGRAGGHYLAHRLAYRLTTGNDPIGLQIDHICHQKLCVNPAHLRPVTHKENLEHRRGAQRGNKSSGVRGVTRNHGSWVAQVGHNGENIIVGRYLTIEEAAFAAKTKRCELFTHNDTDRQ